MDNKPSLHSSKSCRCACRLCNPLLIRTKAKGFFAGCESSTNRSDTEEALREYCQLHPQTPAKKGKTSGHGMLILVLDELDQLRSQDCNILYSLFSLPQVQCEGYSVPRNEQQLPQETQSDPMAYSSQQACECMMKVQVVIFRNAITVKYYS